MGQTVNKWIWQSFRHHFAVVVIRLMSDVEHGLLNVPYFVAQQIYGYHGNGVLVGTVADNIVGVLIVHAQILAEAECLCRQPRLLKLYQNQVLTAVSFAYSGTEVDAEYGQRVALIVAILMGAHLHLDDVHLQECRKDGTRYSLVLHQIFEYDVVNWIGNSYHTLSVLFCLQRYDK